jgi:pimeloyl-ACP methyl ester carboxylesterase
LIPRFFGAAGRQLFSVYHPPAGAGGREAAVVLCHAGPQDYRHTHWAYRKLAGLLAKEGMHVLRFDYYATGDSAGESIEADLDGWTADIGVAARELQDRTGLRRISVVGLRLGGALAARACAQGLKVRDLVLWDPVISGRAYLRQLEAVQARWLRELHYPQDDRREEHELLGYPMTAKMRGDLERLDLLQEGCGTPERLLVIRARHDALDNALVEGAASAGINSSVKNVDDPELYDGSDRMMDLLLAHNIPTAIASYLAKKKE